MIAIRYLLCFTFFYCVNLSKAQNIEFTKSNFKSNKEALKAAKKQIKNGDKYREISIDLFLKNKQSHDEASKALYFYDQANLFNPNNADLNFKIGSSLLLTNKKELAISYILNAENLYKKIPDEFYFYKALTLHLNHQFDSAIFILENFLKNSSKKILKKYSLIAYQYINQCNNAIDLNNHNNKVWIDNLNDINSIYDEINPCITADREILFFSSNRPNKWDADMYDNFNYDIYTSTLNSRDYTKFDPLTDFNSELNDIVSAVSYDGQRVMLYREEDNNLDIFESQLNGLKWGLLSRKMGEKLRGGNTLKDETYASYEPADLRIYYTTNAYGESKDIYFSGIMNRERNIWGTGHSAGIINTSLDEESIFIHPDGKTMYFSSKGHNSIGGYDIFVSYMDDLGHWGKPINMGSDINTPYDELFYKENPSGKYAILSSNRPGGKGGFDIYKITYKGAKKPLLLDSENQLISSIDFPVQDPIKEEYIDIKEKSLTVFKGNVIDNITKQPIKAKINIYKNVSGDLYTSCYSNVSTGKFMLSLPSGFNYGISLEAQDYLFHSENFNIPKNDGFNIVSKEIELKSVKIGSKIELKNVFFNSAKWDILSDSYAELDRLIDFMLEFQSLKIEISGYTDNVGSESFNHLLSQKRAEAVVNYLVENGIGSERLIAIGYGQKNPVASNRTIEGRAANRRTEFKIIEN